MYTGDESGIVGLFCHQHGIRQVPMLEIRRYLDTTFRAREGLCP
jgi:hypothetical protein